MGELTDSLIALGAEHGCEFSAEDLAENVELSDEELDGVAGGMGNTAEGGFRILRGSIAGQVVGVVAAENDRAN